MNDNKIKPYGLFATIVVTTVGVGIFSLPRELAKNVGTDGWIVILITGIISIILTMIACKVLELNNYESFSNILLCNFGRYIGRLIAFVFVVYCVFAIAVQTRVFVEVVKMYLLEKTPTEFLIILTILIGSYIIGFGEKTLIKFNELSFWFMFIPMVLVLIVLIKGANFTNVLPIGQSPLQAYGKEIMQSFLSFAGFEIVFFAAPFLVDKKEVKKAAKRAMIFVTVFYILVVIFTVAIFTKYEAEKILWPTITMVTSIDIPGAFIERWEGVIMSIWILFYFATFINLYYFACTVIRDSFNIRQEKISSVILMPFIYGIAMYSKNIVEINELSEKIVNNLIVAVDIGIPLLLLVISKMRNRKGGSRVEKKKA